MPNLRLRNVRRGRGWLLSGLSALSTGLPRIGPILLIMMCLGTVFPSWAADSVIYRWRDAGGVLHFSDSPPPSGEDAQTFSSGPANDTGTDAVPTKLQSSGVFWRIDNGRTAPSYLLGTIHSADPRVLQWPKAIDDALHQADHFVMEMSLEPENFIKLGGAMMFTDGTDVAELLGPLDYRRLREAMTDQALPESILRRMKPWVLMAMLSQPSSGPREFMDLRLYRMAVSEGKPVSGLETVEEQLAVFDGMPLNDQVRLLRSTLDRLKDLPRLMAQMIDTYLAGDLAAIAALAESSLNDSGTDLEKRFLSRLNDERNHRMAARMMASLEKGGAFIAVGALHLAGPSGIIRQLSDRGFRMTPMI